MKSSKWCGRCKSSTHNYVECDGHVSEFQAREERLGIADRRFARRNARVTMRKLMKEDHKVASEPKPKERKRYMAANVLPCDLTWKERCILEDCPIPALTSSGKPCAACGVNGRVSEQRLCSGCKKAWRKDAKSYLGPDYFPREVRDIEAMEDQSATKGLWGPDPWLENAVRAMEECS
jgi:hypothetical protein